MDKWLVSSYKDRDDRAPSVIASDQRERGDLNTDPLDRLPPSLKLRRTGRMTLLSQIASLGLAMTKQKTKFNMKKNPKAHPERVDYQNLFQRTLADFENYKKRVESEKAVWTDQAKIDFMHSLLPILDNLVLMTEHQPQELKENSWVQGVVLISKQIETTLQSEGIEQIIPELGSDFDPNTEEAVSALEDKKFKPGKIIKVQKPGYKIGNKVIRVAQVITSK